MKVGKIDLFVCLFLLIFGMSLRSFCLQIDFKRKSCIKSLNSIISGDFDHYVIEGGLLYNKKLKSNFLIFLKNQGYDAWDLIHEI